MNQVASHLTQTLSSLSVDSPEWEQNCTALIDELLKRRPICRTYSGRTLGAIQMDILAAARQEMRSLIQRDYTRCHLGWPTIDTWRQEISEKAFRAAITKEQLHHLALALQDHTPRTAEWDMALSELLKALKISGLMTTKGLRVKQKLTDADYDDLRQNTLFWIYEKIQNFPPKNNKNCSFIAWVNERMGWLATERYQEQTDTTVQKSRRSVRRKVRSRKISIEANLKRVTLDGIYLWMGLCFYYPLPQQRLEYCLFILLVMFYLWQSLNQTKTPEKISEFLHQMATEMVEIPTRVTNFGDGQDRDNQGSKNENWQIDQVVAPQNKASMQVVVRRCLLKAPTDPFDKHIRSCPQATFRAIALALLDEVPWKEIAAMFNIRNHSTVSNFYYRWLEKYGSIFGEILEADPDFDWV